MACSEALDLVWHCLLICGRWLTEWDMIIGLGVRARGAVAPLILWPPPVRDYPLIYGPIEGTQCQG